MRLSPVLVSRADPSEFEEIGAACRTRWSGLGALNERHGWVGWPTRFVFGVVLGERPASSQSVVEGSPVDQTNPAVRALIEPALSRARSTLQLPGGTACRRRESTAGRVDRSRHPGLDVGRTSGWRRPIAQPTDQSWWMASRTLSRDARRAGKEAAMSPARVATIT